MTQLLSHSNPGLAPLTVQDRLKQMAGELFGRIAGHHPDCPCCDCKVWWAFAQVVDIAEGHVHKGCLCRQLVQSIALVEQEQEA